jgi:uncharacterized protein
MVSTAKVVAIFSIGLIVVLAAYTIYLVTGVPGCAPSLVPSSFTVNGKHYVFTYVAACEAQREAGLMNKKVTNATTMLFAFPSKDTWTFWMQDTNTSLDIIWISTTGTRGTVVYTAAGTIPESTTYLTPSAPANFAIEAKAGFAAENGIVNGTAIQFD